MLKQTYKKAVIPLLICFLFVAYMTEMKRLTLLYKDRRMEFRPLPKLTKSPQRSSQTRMVINSSLYTGIIKQRISTKLEPISTSRTPPNQYQLNSKPPFIKAPNTDIFIFSAIFVKYTTIILRGKQYFKYFNGSDISNTTDYIVLNGWEDKLIKQSNFTCCIKATNGSILSVISSIKRNWHYLGMAKYQAKQYVCPLSIPTSLVDLITVTAHNASCDASEQYYIKPDVPSDTTNNSIAVCAKITYGSLDPGLLLEWLEAHRYFGVSKIFLYTFKLNSKAMEILYAYENYGFVEMKEFGFPMQSSIRRNVGDKNMQSWNDEQVVVFDCQERVGSYSYVVQVDTDEFLMSEYDTEKYWWKRYFEKRWSEDARLGALHFNSKIHILDWGPSNNKSSLFIGQYLNSTASIMDRAKLAYKPDRIIPGSVFTHGISSLPGFQRPFVMDGHIAMHHYRTCRWEWRRGNTFLHKSSNRHYLRKYESDDLLNDFQRHPSEAVLKISNAIENGVKALKAKFKI